MVRTILQFRIFLLGLVAFLIASSLSSNVVAQEGSNLEDVVHLKDGTTVRGMIIEQIPDKSIKIKATDGTIHSYTITLIDKITKEEKEAAEIDYMTVDPETWLTGAQLVEYRAKMLSIESEKAELINSGVLDGGEVYEWEAFEGNVSLTEEEFFIKTGYEIEASKSADKQNTHQLYRYTGWGMLALGLYLVSTVDMDEEIAENEEEGSLSLKAVSSIILVVFGIFVTALTLNRAANKYAYSSVHPLAEWYNRDLAFKIRDYGK
jgi:hypothetical protein